MTMENSVKVKLYDILSRYVEEGVRYGISRAYKHTDSPSREGIEEAVHNAVMNSICEVLDFE